MTEVLGFAGLGRMGNPMAGRLVSAHYQLLGYDLAGTAARLPRGAEGAESMSELARQTDVLLLSVPDGTASRSVAHQIVETDRRQVQIVIDLSTIGVAAAQDCAEILRHAGVSYIDAPVSGGIRGAQQGSLTAMVATTVELFNRIEPILKVMADNRFRVGDDPGQGQAMKLLNNYVSAAAFAATAEATTFGTRAGLDLKTIVDVLNVSSGRSAASEDKFPRSVIPGTYDFGFAGKLMAKDVQLYLDSTGTVDVPHELAQLVTDLWQRFSQENPDADMTYFHRFVEQDNV